MRFYTNVAQQGNEILVRYVDGDKRMLEKVWYRPTLYVESDEATAYRDIYGTPLAPIEFRSIKDARTHLENNDALWGHSMFVYPYIRENFHDNLADADINRIRVFSIDIETASERGFALPEDPTEEILLITVQDKRTKRKWTFGTRPFDTSKIEHINMSQAYEYREFETEAEMLEGFLRFWAKKMPDVITGWNTEFFDIPYLVHRGIRVVGEENMKALSPWGIVRPKWLMDMGKERLTYKIVGVNLLDYLQLYKKFTYTSRESYKLDYIAKMELKRQKLEHPYKSFREFYTEDWHRFVEYNVIDVEIVDALDDKMKLIELIMHMAFDAKSNFEDVFSAVRTWDCLIYNHLLDQNILTPIVNSEEIEQPHIEGGYVKEPIPGKYKWVVSFDATSLYPSIIRQYNMSPETLTDTIYGVTVDGMVEKNFPEKQNGIHTIAANGHSFDVTKQGQFPQIVARIFKERSEAKKLMLQYERENELTPTDELGKLISKYNNIQLAKKIQLNSLFGAQANKWFRYFEPRIAEGITMTGQFIIKRIATRLNEYLNRLLKTDGIDYVIAIDTDSNYITLDVIVQKYMGDKPEEKIVDLLHKFCEEKISPVLLKACEEIRLDTNAYELSVYFKREAIASVGIWLAKKRYILLVHDSEGIRYDPPKVKITGYDTNRSSTPEIVRDKLKDALYVCLKQEEKDIWRFISEFRETYDALPYQVVAKPTGVKGLTKYAHPSQVFIKGTPYATKAALLYNDWVAKKGAGGYPYIQEGEKIKILYLRQPNHLGTKTIAFISDLPPEMKVSHMVDYDTLFEKTFMKPLEKVLNVIDWSPSPVPTLNSLFE